VSNKIHGSKKQHVKLYIYTTVDEGSKGGESQKNLGRTGGKSEPAGGNRVLGRGGGHLLFSVPS